MDTKEYFERSAALFDERARAITSSQWSDPTSCSEWNVRDLVDHLTNECLWVPPLMEGQTIAEVGDRFDGDSLGDDPIGSWSAARSDALKAVAEPGALDRTVHLSYADVPGHHYIGQLSRDLLIHSWDLAKGIGYDETLPTDLMKLAYEDSKAEEGVIRGSGLFGDEVAAGPNASLQEELLGLLGRKA